MFKIHLLLFYIYIFVCIDLNHVSCAPRFKRISNEEIQNEVVKDLGNKTVIQNMMNIPDTKQENGIEYKSQGKYDAEELNTTPNTKINLIDSLKEDKPIISTCDNIKPDFEVILMSNTPKIQELKPLYKIISESNEPTLNEQIRHTFPKWLIRHQQNKYPNRKALELANMMLGLDDMTMEDNASEYIPQRESNSMFKELEIPPFIESRYCPLHILKKTPSDSDKVIDLDKSTQDFVKICTCSVVRKPTK